MNRKQSAIFASCLLSLCEVEEDESLRYVFRVLSAQAKGRLVSVLSACLAELEKVEPAERGEVLAAIAAHLGIQEERVVLSSPRLAAVAVSAPSADIGAPQRRVGAPGEFDKYLGPGETFREAARKAGISSQLLRQRLRRGLSWEDALTTPVDESKSTRGTK